MWSLIFPPIFRHDFSAVNFKAHKNFFLVIKNTQMVSLISVVFFFHVHLMGRMLRCDHTTFKKIEAKRLENEMSGIINPSFNGLTYI